jgi:hypothetical protein
MRHWSESLCKKRLVGHRNAHKKTHYVIDPLVQAAPQQQQQHQQHGSPLHLQLTPNSAAAAGQQFMFLQQQQGQQQQQGNRDQINPSPNSMGFMMQQQQNNLFLGKYCALMNRFCGSGGQNTTTLPPDPGSSEQ